MPQAADLRYEEIADTRMAFKGARQYAEPSLSCCGWLGLAELVAARGLWNWRCRGSRDQYGREKGQIIRWYGWGLINAVD